MLTETVQHWIMRYGYFALWPLLALGIVGLPIPDETILTFAGFLIYKGELRPILAWATCVLGAVSGITLSYTIGYFAGYELTHWARYIRLKPEHLERARQWFARRGKWTLMFGYYIPGVRHVVAMVAGSSGLRLRTFAGFAYSGAAIWTSSFLVLGYYAGEKWMRLGRQAHRTLLGLGIAVSAAALAYVLLRRRRRRRREAGL